MNGDISNAVAGPSSSSAASSSYTPPLLFLPPPPPPPPKQHLASTQDLLARFHLLPAYDRYVRPFTLPGDDPALQQQPNDPQTPAPGPSVLAPSPATGSAGTVDKGKGRERDSAVATPADADPADVGDADDDDAPGAKGEKKKKNTYRHLIKGIPGKHSLKKDDYLTTMMLVPPKQRLRISHFDAKTQEDAFTVSLEGLKGWNVNALLLESAQAREDRKKRKELKRLAKLQALHGGPASLQPNLQPAAGTIPPSTAVMSTPISQPQPPVQAPIPRKMSASQGQSVPRPSIGTPRPGSRVGDAGAATGGVPKSTVPRPGSAVPRPGSTTTAAVVKPGGVPLPGSKPQQVQGTPTRTGTPMDVDPSFHRGKKREREDAPLVNGLVHTNPNPYATANGTGGANGGYTNGHGVVAATNVVHEQQQQLKPGVMNAKAGTGNIRPRPVKKQRMDMQGQARDVTAPVQQPTPQGV
ncbi:hypothetical protein M413DRAFT_19587 [Hebeloma cylindrosporum]|uniref:Mediator complex subunit 19 n=1 Tax=Hebeloma cylindrosporum TaxID=76867 RepID=A0A0C2YFH7_HEBCY|nr:hypothetical protein M413DRAFT_19587 [Hebeloma cylindrosporum h7]